MPNTRSQAPRGSPPLSREGRERGRARSEERRSFVWIMRRIRRAASATHLQNFNTNWIMQSASELWAVGRVDRVGVAGRRTLPLSESGSGPQTAQLTLANVTVIYWNLLAPQPRAQTAAGVTAAAGAATKRRRPPPPPKTAILARQKVLVTFFVTPSPLVAKNSTGGQQSDALS